MTESNSITILCLASNLKGEEFLRECRRLGCRVFLLTREGEREKAWPRESIDEFFYMPSLQQKPREVINAVSYLARGHRLNRIVALDDLDVEMAATLREHLRLPGMGESTARYFRDKLAMRVKAREAGLRVPDFIHVLNYDRLREWMERVPPSWVLKPRSEAAAAGIKKIHQPGELWSTLDSLGDRQSYYVMEQYIPGVVYHVDGIVSERELLFAEMHRYARPPLDVVHRGGIFSSRTVERASKEAEELRSLLARLLEAFGMVRGVSHTEFIRHDEDGRFYFLETSARVGGANIAEMVEAATGINLWREWARIEVAHARGERYHLPPPRRDYGGVVLSLARQEWPDLGAYTEPEIVFRLHKRHHAGLVLGSPSARRVGELLDEYMERFSRDFLASMPPPESVRE